MPRPDAITPINKARKPAPVFELVKADPVRISLAEQLRPLLEQLLVDGASGVWFRIALYPTARGAAMARGRAVKAFSKGWQWQSARIEDTDQSALYVRRVADDAQI